MEKESPYVQGRVLLSAITLIQYKGKEEADVGSIAELVGWSEELTHHVVNKMEEIGAVKRITGPFKDRVNVLDHLAIEELKGQEFDANIEDEISAFAEKQKAKNAEIQNLFGGKSKDKDNLFASLADDLKTGGKKKKENPLDALTKKD